MAKILIIGFLAVLSSSLIIGLVSVQNKSKIDALEKSQDRGKLTWYAELAKAKGKQDITFHSGIIRYAVPRSLTEALAYYNVVVAQPVKTKSYAGIKDIQTWYKFRIDEELSTPSIPCPSCTVLGEIPVEMLPLEKGEFLVSQLAGEVMIDGVRVISLDPKFPPFEVGKRYVLFMNFDDQKTVGFLRMGPWGTFALGPDEKLESIDKKLKHPVQEELENDLGDSLGRLRMRLKNH